MWARTGREESIEVRQTPNDVTWDEYGDEVTNAAEAVATVTGMAQPGDAFRDEREEGTRLTDAVSFYFPPDTIDAALLPTGRIFVVWRGRRFQVVTVRNWPGFDLGYQVAVGTLPQRVV